MSTTELEYTEFLRFSLKDRIKNDIAEQGILDASEFDNLVCDLVFRHALYEKRSDTVDTELCISIKHELDCNNKKISSMWDASVKANEQPLS